MEIPIKMPGNEKPLTTIIEGRWFSVEKSDRPTLELTRTQKRRIQRQHCTFLKNRDDTQVPPETKSRSTSSGRTNNMSTTRTDEDKISRKTLCPSCFILVNQLEPSQIQGESEPIPVEGQEDWTEEYEEEQLDYEPSTDDQIRLPETGEQEDWTEEYREGQMEYDGELDEETKAFENDLILTRLIVTNFAGGITKTHGILDVDVTVG
ncbi:unnamed protein product [Prunus brigantina]